MTYQDVLNDLINLLKDHKMIHSWGYGNLSDLVTPLQREQSTVGSNEASDYSIDYPYAFINPTSHTLSKNKSTFRFNIIMMDQCTEDPLEVIQVQSECYLYIKDILAHLYYGFDQKYDFNLNAPMTPFKEKYNDTVSGVTAVIEIEIPDPLDDCITPIRP